MTAMPGEKKQQLVQEALAATKGMKFIPSPGPQTFAYFSKADWLLYGGQGGGGKSALLVGLAMNSHKRSLIMRRKGVDLDALTADAIKFNGSRRGFKGGHRPELVTDDGRLLQFAGCQHLGDEQDWQGKAHDLKAFDEVTQFLEYMVRFICGWNRSSEDGQRCRVVFGSNPPLSSDGQFIIGMFRPWLDLTYHNPAKPGELRWVITDEAGKDHWVDGPEPIERDGKTYRPLSRTFIPAAVSDNPFLSGTDYQKVLDNLPEPLRSAVRDGNFMAARKDDACQVIPSEWVRLAQQRWTPQLPPGIAMTALAVDIAQGGDDETVLATRYGGYFPELVSKPGAETKDGDDIAVLVIRHRRDGCAIILDMGGGYGGGAKMSLAHNQLQATPYFGGGESTATARDGSRLKFFNKRAETYWRMREALDPKQEGGSPVTLPNDPELMADLCAARFDPAQMENKIVKIEDKKEIKKRLGRSPDKGDAVVMCLSEGGLAVLKQVARSGGKLPQVKTGYANRKK